MDCGVPFCHQTATGCPLGFANEGDERDEAGAWVNGAVTVASDKAGTHPELLLRNRTGERALGWGGLHVYDHRLAQVRDLWRGNCLELTASGAIDGCGADFSDGVKATGLDPTVAQEWEAGHATMLRDVVVHGWR